MFLCCNVSASVVSKLLTPTRHNRNCPRIRLLYRDFRCLFVTFHFVQVVRFNILLYLHCCFYTCVYRTQLCLLYVYIEVYIVILARISSSISCYASPTTKNGGLHTPIVGR